MADKGLIDNQNMLLGCGLLALILVIGLVVVVILAVNQDRQAARYPGTRLLSSHTDYTALPRHVLWHNTYLTSDSTDDIYDWYVARFNLATVVDKWVDDECFVLYGSMKRLAVDRDLGIMVCETPAGRTIHVTRSILLR